MTAAGSLGQCPRLALHMNVGQRLREEGCIANNGLGRTGLAAVMSVWQGGGAGGRGAMARVRGAMAPRLEVLSGHAPLQDRATAMVKAASAGHKDTVELLLDRGADPEVKDDVSAVVACPGRRAAKSVTGRQRPRRR